MVCCRWFAALILLLVAGAPLLALLAAVLAKADSWSALSEGGRLAQLAWNSLKLGGMTLLIALALGVPAAVLLFRTDLPGRRMWRGLVLVSLFVPLPLVASAWQIALAGLGWSPASETGWLQGIAPAAWVHAMAALPWVVLLVGLGLTWVEPELEEDALLLMPAWRVLWSVTLPRAKPSILLAGVWTLLFTLGEIIVTDRMQVRTFAEEVYAQFVATDSLTEVGRAVAVALPPVLVLMALAYAVLVRWRDRLPARHELLRDTRRFPLGVARLPCLVAVLLGLVLVNGVPLAGLVWKAGLRYGVVLEPGPPAWEAWLVLERVAQAFQRQSGLLLQSLLLAGLTGVVTGMLALVVCWLSRNGRRFEGMVWLLAAALWAIPGPILGIGLNDVIQTLIELPAGELAEAVLWNQPSPLPNLWVCMLRFLPVALAMLWPLVRLIPPQLEEAAVLDGLGPARRFTQVILPLVWLPLAMAMLGVAVLTLSEVSASKIVSTPGFTTLAHHIFVQMHYGADTELAALCLMLLVVVAVLGVAFVWLPRLRLLCAVSSSWFVVCGATGNHERETANAKPSKR